MRVRRADNDISQISRRVRASATAVSPCRFDSWLLSTLESRRFDLEFDCNHPNSIDYQCFAFAITPFDWIPRTSGCTIM